MTFPTCMTQQRARLVGIWSRLKAKLGFYPTVLANDGGQWEPGLVTVRLASWLGRGKLCSSFSFSGSHAK